MANETQNSNPPLAVATPEKIKTDLGLNLSVGENKTLEVKAAEIADRLVTFTPAEIKEQADRKEAIEQMGVDVQRRAAKQSELLRQPIRKLSQSASDKGDVGNALLNLKMKIEDLDPGKFDFEPGWFSRTLGRLPGIGSPLKRYFSKFESSQTVISTIIRSLEGGRDQLIRDNITLSEDQLQMREMTKKLEQSIQLGQLVDQKLEYKTTREIPESDPRNRFIKEELLFPLRQRIMDLQQQLAVHQQGVIASELIMRNNKELVRGVNRALNVTVTALEVGATVAMALANQKIVLDKIDAVSKTTSDLIAGTAQRLRTQGVEIQKQASSAQLSLDSLKSAFADLKAAMDDIGNFRVNALPQMASTVLELDRLSGEAEKSIKKMETANHGRPEIKFDVD